MSASGKVSAVAPRASDVLADPAWFLQDYDTVTRKLRFVRTTREALANQPFLAEGLWNYAPLPQTLIAESAIADALPESTPLPRANFIWHTAFCCSTLIARALDREGSNLSLKEPGVLLTLADAKRQRAMGPGKPLSYRFPEIVLRLLARPFADGEQVTFKPTNSGNYALRDAAALTLGKHLFLFSDCRSFVISIAKKGEYGRRYVRDLYTRILGDGNEQGAWPVQQVFAYSDLQLAAIVWHMQIAEFHRSWPMLKDGRAASLDCDAFLADPVEALSKIDAFLGLGLGREHLASVVASPIFAQHSKDTTSAYGIASRRADHGAAAAGIERDLDDIVSWSYDLCRRTPVGAPLPQPLIQLEKAYRP
jgi:hypothetical protein